MSERNILSIDELWAAVGGNFSFTFDALLGMASESEILGDDGLLIHRQDETYFIPKASITEYFTIHPRPNKRMTREDERTALLKKISELEKLNASLQQTSVKPERTAHVLMVDAVVKEASAENESSESPLFDKTPPAEPSQGMDDIKRDLEKSLLGKQPVRSKK
jgi:hypothetical protein